MSQCERLACSLQTSIWNQDQRGVLLFPFYLRYLQQQKSHELITNNLPRIIVEIERFKNQEKVRLVTLTR